MATQPRKSRSVIVTGGASGLGKAMSAYFAALGDAVTILDIDEAGGAAVSAELGGGEEGGSNVGFRRCDISSWAEQAAAFKAVYEGAGRVDVVVANAGVSEGGRSWVVPPAPGRGALGDEPEEPRLKVLDVNLIGNVYSVKLALHYMQRNTQDATTGLRGCIVCTASSVGLYPFPPQPLYAASKHGIVGLVRSLGPVYGLPHVGIRINALAPAALESNIAGPHAFYRNLVMTPHSTLIAGLERLLTDTALNGQVAEIHGESVTLRPPHEVVDADSRHNLVEFGRGTDVEVV
ncbi:15-hydroxyprostaglandin dehydrogenase [Hypoxylon argillaceum]|nr:15-hydroxyprostaglandin dehydrogenase [Hypoxylon argillaceum]